MMELYLLFDASVLPSILVFLCRIKLSIGFDPSKCGNSFSHTNGITKYGFGISREGITIKSGLLFGSEFGGYGFTYELGNGFFIAWLQYLMFPFL